MAESVRWFQGVGCSLIDKLDIVEYCDEQGKLWIDCADAKAITQTYLYNFDPLKPHFYTVKLWFTGVYIILLISAQKHRLWVLIRTASRRFERVPTIYV